ncbi:MAG: PDDEXK nuclease domain-containing protein [Niabella sp.]
MLTGYKKTIKELKSMILASRYRAAALANKELLLLYFSVGKLITEKVKSEKWGAKVLEQVAADLQKELPGLRGFSSTNLKRMRIFYETWDTTILTDPILSDQIGKSRKNEMKNGLSLIGPTVSDQLKLSFFSISFSHHTEILAKIKDHEDRLFYIQQAAENFWSLAILENHIKSNLSQSQGKIANNFSKSMPDETLRERALQTFKDEYLLDFINIEDPELVDEREFENEIVRNIRKFVLSIGNDFAFIGNQYRLQVGEEDFFVDLLFFNRKLQSLVAFELKKGKFRPEYLGKMNFYLSALDDMVKQPHENSSIGIILCKNKTNKVVEFSFRDFNKAMGVATYKTSKNLPEKYKGILPDPKDLKELL